MKINKFQLIKSWALTLLVGFALGVMFTAPFLMTEAEIKDFWTAAAMEITK